MDFHNVTKDTLIIAASVGLLAFCIGYLVKTFLTWGYTPKVKDEIKRIIGREEGSDV